MNREAKLLLFAAAIFAVLPVMGRSEASRCAAPNATLLASGLQGPIGSTVGPDGALYVAEGVAGRVSRIDPNTGQVATFVSGLPKRLPGFPIGGPIDVSFIGNTAYVLVTLVGPTVGGSNIDGIYRVDGPDRSTVVANLGAWSAAHPPKTPFDNPGGLQFAMEAYRGGFLVTDGHHNRVLWVTVDGCMTSAPEDESNITELIAFEDIVPTGLTVGGNTIYMAEAGPIPHLPENGKIVEFTFKSPSATVVASGAPLLVDVAFGPRHRLYALAQGIWAGKQAGDPALPNTGSVVQVNDDGGFTLIADHLDRPTSLEFIDNTAYVVSLAGEVWKIEDLSCRRDDKRR